MKTQMQRIFSFLVLLTMVIVLTCIFVACDNNGGSQDHDYKVIGIPDRIVGLSNFSDVILREKGAIKRYGKH